MFCSLFKQPGHLKGTKTISMVDSTPLKYNEIVYIYSKTRKKKKKNPYLPTDLFWGYVTPNRFFFEVGPNQILDFQKLDYQWPKSNLN